MSEGMVKGGGGGGERRVSSVSAPRMPGGKAYTLSFVLISHVNDDSGRRRIMLMTTVMK